MKNILILAVVLVFSSCTYNKEELPAPESVTPPSVSVTYSSHAKALIDNNCISCHSSSGGQNPFLTTYAEVSGQSARIQVRAINGTPTPMPPSGSLPQNVKDTLQMWIDQGALQ